MSAELELLSRIQTVSEAVAAFPDSDRCRRQLESMVWPRGSALPVMWVPSVDLLGRPGYVASGT